MKKFLNALAKIKRILFWALVIRLLLLPLSFHSDLNNNAIWGIYAQEFGFRGFYDWLNFGNFARPDYPPLAIIMFWAIRLVWQQFFNFFWFINVKLPLFPSAFIPWFEAKGFLMLIKIPGVLADLGIGYLLYQYVSQKYSDKKAKLAAKLFLFNPAMIYLSASWGQLDSIVCLFGLLALLLILNKKYFSSLFFFFTSIMLKVTMIMLAPFLFFQSLNSKISLNKIFILIITTILYLTIIGYVFIDHNYTIWTINTYWHKFIPGAVTLPYINLNAFNFWGLLLGLDRIKDEALFQNLSLYRWGWLLFVLTFLYIFYKYLRNNNIFHSIFMTYFAAFLFMPRVHERYLYPIFVFAPILIIIKKMNKKIFYILSVMFLINLYHWWWFPNIPILVSFFDFEIVERLLSLTNTLIFIYLFRKYAKEN